VMHCAQMLTPQALTNIFGGVFTFEGGVTQTRRVDLLRADTFYGKNQP
jgi:hypothetical protein